MKRIIFCILSLLLISSVSIQAQELNAKVTINKKVQSNNMEVFSSMENTIIQLLNEHKWTDVNFNTNERIDCTVTITINQMPDERNFVAEIQVTSRRPVYNSTYITPLINYRDVKFEFPYTSGQPIYFNNMNVDNNFVATIAFYVYIIIGLDFDSYSINGGRQYFEKAMAIANTAQSFNTPGWEPFSRNNSRYDLAVALTEESTQLFHEIWYKYHRMGLDEMAANPDRGRIRIIEVLSDLEKLYEARQSAPLILIFGETKLDEILKICSKATSEEKQAVKKILSRLFPAKTSIINTLQ